MKTKDLLKMVEEREEAEAVLKAFYDETRCWHIDCACRDCDKINKYHDLTWLQKWRGYFAWVRTLI